MTIDEMSTNQLMTGRARVARPAPGGDYVIQVEGMTIATSPDRALAALLCERWNQSLGVTRVLHEHKKWLPSGMGAL